MDARQGFIGDDSTLINFHGENHIVGAAKGVSNVVVQINIGMILWEQVGEIRDYANGGNLRPEYYRQQNNYR